MLDGKSYVNNHLMFKILVHESNGQYTLGKAHSQAELEAAASVEVRAPPAAAAAAAAAYLELPLPPLLLGCAASLLGVLFTGRGARSLA